MSRNITGDLEKARPLSMHAHESKFRVNIQLSLKTIFRGNRGGENIWRFISREEKTNHEIKKHSVKYITDVAKG